MTTTNNNLENTCEAIASSWSTAHSFDAKGETETAIYCWNKILDKLDGMWSMANWVLQCDETMAFITELKVIARIHYNRTYLLK